jgi:hypothetical protein
MFQDVQRRFWADSNSEKLDLKFPSGQPSHASGCPSVSRSFEQFDEYQVLYIWTPWFTLVRPFALLFSDVFVSFCVLVFYRLIREEWQNFMWKYLEIRKSSIDQNFPELTFAEAHQNTHSRASPWQKAVSLWFSQQNTFHDLGCL